MKKEKMKQARKIMIGVLYLLYIIYLYFLLSKWEQVSGGNIFIGIIQAVIPLSAIIFINLILNKKIKILITI